MPTPAVLRDDLLRPIRPDKPGGDDLRPTIEWIRIRDVRPNLYDQGDKGIWTPRHSKDAGWPQLFEKTTAALREKSKDLQLAIWLTEASTRIHGFAGLRDTLKLIREMLLQFWDAGLFPGVEIRSGPLDWLNDKLADLIREIPVTGGPGDNGEYSYAQFLASRKPEAAVTAEQFDQALRSTAELLHMTMLEDLQLAAAELDQLELVTAAKFGPGLISFSSSKEALEECREFLENAVAQKRRLEAPQLESEADPEPACAAVQEPVDFAVSDHASEGWAKAEELVRNGRVSEGLADMTRLAATEANGRARFQRKLLLADICLSSKREFLARTILEELAEQIDKHHLEEWETPEVVGGVWSRLYRCYSNEKSGTANPEQAAKLFLRLCRLDPWQALACNSDGH